MRRIADSESRITRIPVHTGKLRSGFTLMELLVVIAIIGILVTIALASYSTAQKKSRDTRRIGDMKSVQNAWEQYYADNNANYPGTSTLAACALTMMPTPETYLPAGFPTDPKTGSTSFYPDKDGWSRCKSDTYCFCAGVEVSTSKNGSVDCAGGTSVDYPSGFYCVRNLQ